MRTFLDKASRIAVAVVVALALGVGVYEAAPRITSNCPFSPPDNLGACVDTADCQQKCDVEWGRGNSEGICAPFGEEMCCACWAI
jgi:hypothetical protein